MKKNPPKVKPVSHDIQSRPLDKGAAAVITKMKQNLADKAWEHQQGQNGDK